MKYSHFGNILKALVNFLRVYLVFGKILNLLWPLFYVNGPIFTVVNGQILNNSLAIWSHSMMEPYMLVVDVRVHENW